MTEQEIINGLAEILERGAQERARLQEQLSALQEKERGTRTALRALAPEHPLIKTTGSKRKSRQPAYKKGNAKPETVRAVARWIAGDGADEFNAAKVASGTQLSDTTVRKALDALRDAEAVLSIGRKPTRADGGGGKSETYVRGDNDALQAAAKEVTASA